MTDKAKSAALFISIHAPRTGSDSIGQLSTRVNSAISIHAPRTGSDVLLLIANARTGTFQSTLPARGATTSSPASCCRRCHFNPRSPHGERLFINSRKSFASGFQSTLPARGATKHRLSYDSQGYISIHAPRTGSDGYRRAWRRRVQAFQSTLPARGATPRQRLHCPRGTDFNPRSPHGERRWRLLMPLELLRFQSTLPARGATGDSFQRSQPYKFQSTLPARGATVNRRHSVTAYK